MAELPERLREAAGAHRPDRERMLARVERAMIAHGRGAAMSNADRPPAPWMRVAAVTAAAASAIGIGSLAVGAVSNDGDPGQNPGRSVATSTDTSAPAAKPPAAPATAPEHTGGRHRSPGHHGNGRPAEAAGTGLPSTAPPTPTTPPVAPTASPPASGTAGPPASGTGGAPGTGSGASTQPVPPLPPPPRAPLPPPPSFPGDWGGTSTTASTASDSAGRETLSSITLTIGRPLTSLTVELRVLATPEVAGTNAFSSDSAQTGVTVGAEGGFLVYRWTLDAGQVLQPGTYVFSGQFSHAAGRDTSGDSYAVTGDGEGGPVSSGGGF